jgi:hypothetical protein
MQDQIKAAPDGGLYIFSMQEKPGWRPRAAGDQTHAPHPGSAIRYQENLYELMAIQPAEGTPYAYRYLLRPWEDRFVVRQVFPYSEEIARETGRQLQEQRRQHAQNTWVTYWFALTGLLPTHLATRWEREWGLPLRRAAWFNMFLLAIVAMTVGPAWEKEHGMDLIARACLFLQVEQGFRFVWLMSSNNAVGSTLPTIPWLLWAFSMGRNADGSRRRRRRNLLEVEKDEVRYLTRGEEATTQPWDIEVRSVLRDPVLLGAAPVRFDGNVYQPLGCVQEGQGIGRRYVFRLKKLEPATVARREYFRERDAAEIAKLLPYERARDAAHTFGFLCGFLPAGRQVELERKYELNAGLWTQRSAWVMAVSMAVQAWWLWGQPVGIGHVVLAYFTLETAWRLYVSYSRGEPAGSALGWVLLPLLRF